MSTTICSARKIKWRAYHGLFASVSANIDSTAIHTPAIMRPGMVWYGMVLGLKFLSITSSQALAATPLPSHRLNSD